LLNPVVVYSDDTKLLERFRRARGNLTTELIFMNRTELWSFQLEPRIAKIFAKPKYPKHHPNTVVPLYSCANHAKYDVVSLAIQSNYFNTKYFAWVDLGYWRDMGSELGAEYKFLLTLPPRFNHERVAFTEAFVFVPYASTTQIFLTSWLSMAGGFFIGHGDKMLLLTENYRYTTEKYMKRGLANSDQQVIYAMYAPLANSDTPKVQVQRYAWDKSSIPRWMYLGYYIRNQWYNRHNITFLYT